MSALSDFPWLELGSDALIVALLVATIAYAVVLDRRLKALRAAQPEMERVLAQFSEVTARAEGGLAALRDAAEETGRSLDSAIEKGNGIADDLVFLVDRAGKLADRLAATPGPRRAAAEAAPPPMAEAPSAQLRALR